MRSDKTARAAAAHLQDHSSVIALLFDQGGRILDANRSARDQVLGDREDANITEVFIDFTETLDVESLIESGPAPRMLSVNGVGGLPRTYYFHFYDLGDSALALGETDHEEAARLRESLFETNIELSNLTRELHKKTAELERLNELKNEFIGMAAHDLRSPMGAIKGYSDLLLSKAAEVLPETHLSFLKTIRELSEFMLQLLNDLLDITSIESGKLKLDIGVMDFKRFVEDTVTINTMIAEKQGIELVYDLPDSLPDAQMDAFKMRQVLENLISNALKYSSEGTTVGVRVRSEDDVITVSVSDQGQGIPDEDMPKLFKPFSRANVQSPTGQKSTGLGLAIVQKIVSAHRGRAWAESAVGVGSTFHFSIPTRQDT